VTRNGMSPEAETFSMSAITFSSQAASPDQAN